jgi:FPC/CPF motif-containing protein YcgG
MLKGLMSAEEAIKSLILKKSYPCVAAIQSVAKHDYVIKSYSSFGQGESGRKLREDLIQFLILRNETNSRFLSFWAIFEDSSPLESEMDFEEKLWKELSMISSEDEQETDWGKNSTDPLDPSFCISLQGDKLFVVGLHPESSRFSRRFYTPALVFNSFTQFKLFQEEGTYEAMVKTNRARDVKFQGSVNPMVEQYGEQWEAIQFSGRNNSSDWKCPFHLNRLKDKPT